MRRRLLVVATMVVALSLSVAVPAGAGGWWSYVDFDRSNVAAGDRLTSRTELLFTQAGMAADARSDQYFAYLVRGIDRQLLNDAMMRPSPKRWWVQPKVAIQLGRVRLVDRPSGLVQARVAVRIPDVPPGRYAVMLCDKGCRSPLADTIPTDGIRVHATPAAAHAAEVTADLKQLQWDTRSMDESLALENDALRSRAERAGVVASQAQESARNAELAVRGLEARVEALAAVAPIAERAAVPAWWLSVAAAGWAVAALLALLWFSGRRNSRAGAQPEPQVDEPSDPAASAGEWELASRR